MADETKYDEFVNNLKTNYPKIFAKPYGGVCVGPGWWPIIESLCANIQQHIDFWNRNHDKHPIVEQVVVTQIKEKFGGLRFYYDGGDEYISGMVTIAEEWAACHCEECGKPGRHRSGGWIRTLCDEHEAERQARMKERFNI